MARIAIVKYNAGNIRSVLCALHRLGHDALVTDDPRQLRSARRVIFPGVGEASSAMEYLRQTGLDELLRSLEQPFLGICLGMQLMCSRSEEHDTSCLGMFEEPVVRFASEEGMKIPHMGWNTIEPTSDPLFAGIEGGSFFYFVHSYHVPASHHAIASCTYGRVTFSAALGNGPRRGVQFHPEKSGPAGARLLLNFLESKEDRL